MSNRGMEGLAITPDGRTLVGIMQNPLAQDGGRNGLNVRVLVIELSTGSSKELIYPLNNRSYGVNELVAINSTEFLADERDGAAGNSAVAKRIDKINIAAATDVSAIATLPLTGLPVGSVAATKSLFLDLLNPAFGLVGTSFPETIEGLAIGPAPTQWSPNVDHHQRQRFFSGQPKQLLRLCDGSHRPCRLCGAAV